MNTEIMNTEIEERVAGEGQGAAVQAEAGLLAAVLADETPGSWARALKCGVRSAAFWDARHRAIWVALDVLHGRGQGVDMQVLMAHLQEGGLLEDAGGLSYVVELCGTAPTSARVVYFAELVRLYWEKRTAERLAREIAELSRDKLPREDWISGVAQRAQRLIGLGKRGVARTAVEQADDVRESFLARAAGTEDRRGWIYTGLDSFDGRLSPLGSCSAGEDHLVVFAGGSSTGKSVAMRQLVSVALDRGQTALVFSRETSNTGFIGRLSGLRARVNLRTLHDAPADLVKRLEAETLRIRDEFLDKRLFVVEHTEGTPLETIEDLEQHVRAFAHLRGAPDLVVVDYLQLFGTRKRCNSREQEVATVSHKLQSLCRQIGGVWLVGCQMNESGLAEMRVARRDDKGKLIHRMPRAGDLRESQAIYHDADRVICLYVPPEDCRGMDQTGPNVLHPEEWWVQIKCRDGVTGGAKCWFDKRLGYFKSFTAEDEAACPPPPPDKAPSRSAGDKAPSGGGRDWGNYARGGR